MTIIDIKAIFATFAYGWLLGITKLACRVHTTDTDQIIFIFGERSGIGWAFGIALTCVEEPP